MKMCKWSSDVFRTLSNIYTPCLSPPTKTSTKNYPVKIWSVKSFPGEKNLSFLFPSLLHNLVHLRQMLNY